MTLTILCVDGLLEHDHPKRPKVPKMPYERKLTIPEELKVYDGIPYTLHIWPSMFTGEIHIYPVKLLDPQSIRFQLRSLLQKLNLSWSRRGLKIAKSEKDLPIEWKMKPITPKIDRSILDQYHSFNWNIPGVSPYFIFGKNELIVDTHYTLWKILARVLQSYNYQINAIYTEIIDAKGHWMKKIDHYYTEIYDLALSLPGEVMIVSDHGIMDGEHTDHAYLGCTHQIHAKSILDIPENIVRILGNE